jgi:hypothetical protein
LNELFAIFVNRFFSFSDSTHLNILFVENGIKNVLGNKNETV